MRAPLVVIGLLAPLLLAATVAGPAAGGHSGGLDVGYSDVPTAVDGVFGTTEYGDSLLDSATGILIAMQHSGGILGVGLEVPGTGWVAVTLGAVLVGSNYTDLLEFSLENGTLRARDLVDHGWEVHLDEAVGGTDDVLAAAAVPIPGGLRLEFQVPLDSPDVNDHHFLPNGTYPFSVAFNATSTDPTAPHTAHSSGLLLEVGPVPGIVSNQRAILQVAEPRLVAGQESTLWAILRNESGAPLTDLTVEFYQETTFGPLFLGLGRTSAYGRASVQFEPQDAGTWTFWIVFRGTLRYAPTNATLEVTVAPAPGDLLAPFPTTLVITAVVFVVLGGVWSSYAFVLGQLRGIQREGRNITRLNSREGKGGD